MMKYSFLIILLLLTSTAQASYCSGKNWHDAYQFYTHNIDVLNDHIDRYNGLLNQNNARQVSGETQPYLQATYVIAELDKLSNDVEELGSKFTRVKELWQLIRDDCLNDDELDYNSKAIENMQGADIGRTEVNDLLSRIEYLRVYLFQVVEVERY
ncbi:MAG: hypothetical protein QNK26_01940 [Moritella sp.]|uniref:hypothetical protein n=1 Tax=Moritella sp. TaxID=78556 RepID=UPI0029AC91DF|nr:hypothetical protein [Moritella sp.]MDX2319338.1 hypothetical protein [Moritella sp.]